LRRGDKFGEVALVKDCVRTAWVLSEGYTILSSLARHRIEPIWKHFQTEKEDLVKKVKETAEKDRKRVLNQKFKKMVKTGLGKTAELKAIPFPDDNSKEDVSNQLSGNSEPLTIPTVDGSRDASVQAVSSAGGVTPSASGKSNHRRSSRENALYMADRSNNSVPNSQDSQLISGDSAGIDEYRDGTSSSHNHEGNLTDLMLEGFSQLSTRMDTFMQRQACLERMVMSLSCRLAGDTDASAGRPSSVRSLPIEEAMPWPLQPPPYVPVLPPPDPVASEKSVVDRACHKKRHKKQVAGTSTNHDAAHKLHRARHSKPSQPIADTPSVVGNVFSITSKE